MEWVVVTLEVALKTEKTLDDDALELKENIKSYSRNVSTKVESEL